ncbi:MAG: FAD:protein FMN transferase [Eubacteriales bacterium]|nr:FAD:protein FMN transferase [Eubacteriales bacterium]
MKKSRIITISTIIAFICFASALVLFAGCRAKNIVYKKYEYEFFGSFDTLIQFSAYTKTEEEFNTMRTKCQERFEELHRLYDIYNDYDGLNNAKTVNNNAGIAPVKVAHELIDVIELSKEWHEKTCNKVNISLGPVLNIWHNYREEGIDNPDEAKLPSNEELQAANVHTDINKVKVDKEQGTVFLEEQGMRLDLGAVAKGYATELIAHEMEEQGYDSFLIISGGNVRTVGAPKAVNKTEWSIGIQDPGEEDNHPNVNELLNIAYIKDAAMVSSGDYQRYYMVDGKMIHHIIDPETLYPADKFRAVTILTQDSCIADLLSTSLFILSYEEGKALVESMEGVEALWVMKDKSIEMTDGMRSVLRDKE